MAFSKLAFFEDLGYEPHPGQLEVHRSQAPRRALSCGVRWGKSKCAAMEAIAAAMEPRKTSIGWCVAPTYDLADRVFREIVIIAAEHLRHRIISMKESERRLILRNMAGGISEIRGKSADNPVSLLGEGLDWLIVDEASRLKPAIWEGHLSQRLIDKKGWALLISTPKGKGWFYDFFRRGEKGEEGFQSWNSPSWENPHVDKALIDAERDRLPARVFDQEYGAKFVEGEGSVFRNVREVATLGWQEPVEGETYCAGLDLAKVNDYTVLTILNAKGELVFADRFHRLDWNLQINRIKAGVERFNNACVYVDSTGAGEPIYEGLCREGIYCRAYQFTAKSKAALIDNLALMFEKRRIALPRPELWPEGIEELENFEFSVSDAGNVRTSAPGGHHDDCVISLALGCWWLKDSMADLKIEWIGPPAGGWW